MLASGARLATEAHCVKSASNARPMKHSSPAVPPCHVSMKRTSILAIHTQRSDLSFRRCVHRDQRQDAGQEGVKCMKHTRASTCLTYLGGSTHAGPITSIAGQGICITSCCTSSTRRLDSSCRLLPRINDLESAALRWQRGGPVTYPRVSRGQNTMATLTYIACTPAA